MFLRSCIGFLLSVKKTCILSPQNYRYIYPFFLLAHVMLISSSDYISCKIY